MAVDCVGWFTWKQHGSVWDLYSNTNSRHQYHSDSSRNMSKHHVSPMLCWQINIYINPSVQCCGFWPKQHENNRYQMGIVSANGSSKASAWWFQRIPKTLASHEIKQKEMLLRTCTEFNNSHVPKESQCLNFPISSHPLPPSVARETWGSKRNQTLR